MHFREPGYRNPVSFMGLSLVDHVLLRGDFAAGWNKDRQIHRIWQRAPSTPW